MSVEAAIVEISGVEKVYRSGEVSFKALRGVDLTVRRGEFIAIVGASGSGKSTLMNIIGCLDRPTAGSYRLIGHDVAKLSADQRATVRSRFLGFVFQGFMLLPRTTAIENVELPLIYAGVSARERRRRSLEALRFVGLHDKINNMPTQLSGGQQQRVAIARALVSDPKLLLADEPTGNLDTRTTEDILVLLQGLNRDRGLTIVMVTHESDVANCTQRIITMVDGLIDTDIAVEHPRIARSSGSFIAAHSDALAPTAPASAAVSEVTSP